MNQQIQNAYTPRKDILRIFAITGASLVAPTFYSVIETYRQTDSISASAASGLATILSGATAGICIGLLTSPYLTRESNVQDKK
jgi:hypothetical protein